MPTPMVALGPRSQPGGVRINPRQLALGLLQLLLLPVAVGPRAVLGPPHERPPLVTPEDDSRGGAGAIERDVLGEHVERRVHAVGQLALLDELVAEGLVARPGRDTLLARRR